MFSSDWTERSRQEKAANQHAWQKTFISAFNMLITLRSAVMWPDKRSRADTHRCMFVYISPMWNLNSLCHTFRSLSALWALSLLQINEIIPFHRVKALLIFDWKSLTCLWFISVCKSHDCVKPQMIVGKFCISTSDVWGRWWCHRSHFELYLLHVTKEQTTSTGCRISGSVEKLLPSNIYKLAPEFSFLWCKWW